MRSVRNNNTGSTGNTGTPDDSQRNLIDRSQRQDRERARLDDSKTNRSVINARGMVRADGSYRDELDKSAEDTMSNFSEVTQKREERDAKGRFEKVVAVEERAIAGKTQEIKTHQANRLDNEFEERNLRNPNVRIGGRNIDTIDDAVYTTPSKVDDKQLERIQRHGVRDAVDADDLDDAIRKGGVGAGGQTELVANSTKRAGDKKTSHELREMLRARFSGADEAVDTKAIDDKKKEMEQENSDYEEGLLLPPGMKSRHGF